MTAEEAVKEANEKLSKPPVFPDGDNVTIKENEVVISREALEVLVCLTEKYLYPSADGL